MYNVLKYTGFAHASQLRIICAGVRAYAVSSDPGGQNSCHTVGFSLFFHVNKWYIFSAYNTYGFTVHFSLDLNNYKWTFSTLKDGTNISRARYLSLSLSLSLFTHSRTHSLISRPFSLSFFQLSFFLSRTLSRVNLFCFTYVPYKRLYIWLYVLLAIKDESFFFPLCELPWSQ